MLTGKRFLITGGTGYLGQAICRIAKFHGAEVHFTYHRAKDKAMALAEELGGTALYMDMRNIPEMQKSMEAFVVQQGPIDALVNNASIAQAMPLAMLEEEDADEVFDINIKGTLFVTRAAIKSMIRQKKGSIVSIGSIAGHRLLDVPVTYAMSKAAIMGMTYALTAELKKFHIRVNCVVPGMLESGVAKGIPDDLRQLFLSHVAVGRIGSAQEVAETVCFLASDRASYINGQCIHVDGGI